MGRIFETRKATMFARWNKMAKAFTRVAKELTIAAKGGSDASVNPSLRRAIQNARALNMPKDKIEGAIKRASGPNMESYDELLYEGYGPHGVAILIVSATNNPTRTVANVRTHFKGYGGNMGAAGSVLHSFRHMGVVRLKPEGLDQDELELELIDHGLQELGESTNEKGEPVVVLRSDFKDFGALQAAIEAKGLVPISAEAEYIPQTTVELAEAQASELFELVDAIEQDEDVQRVFHNLV